VAHILLARRTPRTKSATRHASRLLPQEQGDRDMGDISGFGNGEHLLSDQCGVLLLSVNLLSRLQNPFCKPKQVTAGSRWNRDLEVYIVALIPLSIPGLVMYAIPVVLEVWRWSPFLQRNKSTRTSKVRISSAMMPYICYCGYINRTNIHSRL
jgi:hypothetical protein